ncbi:MAG: helix-turn-helix transcriptional regulator, partial [Candidatus Sericytochromatia bacterium]|nr:helix-turn-helix transcriptional regulator [Candidatus Sericytochromatia bacterium]
MQTSIKLGEEIKKVRTSLNLDQKDFAKLIGITNVYLSNIEKGKKIPSQDLLTKVFKVINQEIPQEILELLNTSHSDKKNKSENISNNIIYSLQENGLYDYAKLKESLKTEPDNIALILGFLSILKEQGKLEEARQHLLQSLIHIKKEEIKRWLEASYFLLERNFVTAIELMKKSIEIFSLNTELTFEEKKSKAGLLFELANMYFEYGYDAYNSKFDQALAIECFTNSQKYFSEQRELSKEPSYEMYYANVFWWLAFLGVDSQNNWLSYIDKAENVLLINHEQTMKKSLTGKPSKSMYSEHYLMQVISAMAESYAQLAKIEFNKSLSNQENPDSQKINYYLKKGELLLVQHAPLRILPERREYYNFYFSYSCFYSIKAEINSYLNQDYNSYLDLCEKGLEEAVFSDNKNT